MKMRIRPVPSTYSLTPVTHYTVQVRIMFLWWNTGHEFGSVKVAQDFIRVNTPDV